MTVQELKRALLPYDDKAEVVINIIKNYQYIVYDSDNCHIVVRGNEDLQDSGDLFKRNPESDKIYINLYRHNG